MRKCKDGGGFTAHAVLRFSKPTASVLCYFPVCIPCWRLFLVLIFAHVQLGSFVNQRINVAYCGSKYQLELACTRAKAVGSASIRERI